MFLEENLRKQFHNLGIGNIFLGCKKQSLIWKNDKLNFPQNKTKIFCPSKFTVSEKEQTATTKRIQIYLEEDYL